MSSRGNLRRMCVKGHNKTEQKCSSRCLRWYPRIELERGADGKRCLVSLGGYPTRKQAEAAVAKELARRKRRTLDTQTLTVNAYLDRYLAHIRTIRRARTVQRYAELLRDHVRPHIGTRLLRALETLEIQAIYDHLLVAGRKDGKPGGLAPQHILSVHRCLHRALEQAVTWQLLDRNAAKHATPPPVPETEVAALTPEQVDLLLAAAAADPSPWRGAWTVLAAATGARAGELCALEWSDLDLAAGTVRFRQALANLDTAHLPDTDPTPPAEAAGEAEAATSRTSSGAEDNATEGAGDRHAGRRRELVAGPVKSKASKAILNLPAFAVAALRRHRHQQRQLRLAGAQPATVTLRWVQPGQLPRPIELDLVFRTQRGTTVNPNHAARAFTKLASQVGLDAHPHMLRHALASAMAANKEPASIIATQLRHADGGALAQRVYIHQLPQTAPRLAAVIEGVFGPAAAATRQATATPSQAQPPQGQGA